MRPLRDAWGARWHFSLGRSMIEMLGVLAIIGILSAGGIMGYSAAMDNYRINKTIDDIHTMAANMRTFLLGKPSAVRQDITADKLLTIGVIPISYKLQDPVAYAANAGSATCRVTSAFGTPFDIYFADRPNSRILFVRLCDPPFKACVKLAMHDWKSTGAYGSVIQKKSGEFFFPPLSMSDAKTFCQGAAFILINLTLNKGYSVN